MRQRLHVFCGRQAIRIRRLDLLASSASCERAITNGEAAQLVNVLIFAIRWL